MIKAQDLRELATNTFELQCGAMRLHQGSVTKDPGSSGAGYIRQLPTGELSLVMFIGGQPWPQEVGWDTRRKSGELYSDEDYYSLEALDFAGRRWTALCVWPNFTQLHGTGEPLWMAEATLRELQGEERLRGRRTGSNLQLWYRGDIEFPFNVAIRQLETAGDRKLSESISIAAAEFAAQDYQFFVRHEAGFLVISVSASEDHLEPNLERRVHEAMEFILARRLAWAAVARRDGTELSWRLTGAPTNEKGGRMQLPVAFTSGIRHECDAALDLFRRYLKRIGSHRGPGLPPLSVAVKSALEGARSPLDAHALDLAVAVEAILNTEFAELSQCDEDFQSELTRVQEAVDSLAISDETKRRLSGRISSMASPSAKGRLLELRNRGVIGETELRAWEHIRHRVAHGTFIADLDQDYVDACFRLQTLLYRLIFASVGYVGPYRDYGELDWPWRNE